MLRMTALADVPRWAVLAAHAVPLITLPSGLWRIGVALGLPLADYRPVGWEAVYVVGLSVASEALALLTLGLVRAWGEVVPRWVPLLGGRRVPPRAAVVPALTGAAGLAALCAWSFCAQYAGLGEGRIGTPAQELLLVVCYVPLLAWPPLLVAVTVAYGRRRATA